MFDYSKLFTLYANAPLNWLHYSIARAITSIVNKSKLALLREGEESLYHRIDFERWYIGYMKTIPTEGIKIIIDMPIKYQTWKGTKTEVNKTGRSVHLQQKFGDLEAVIGNSSAELTPVAVHFIVPLVGRLKIFKRFLKSFEKTFLLTRDNVKLLIVYFPEVACHKEHKKQFASLVERYYSVEMTWLDVKGPFKRTVALQMGTNYFGNNSLLYYCDVDLVFERGFTDRCRSNAALGNRIFFPITFRRFNPNIFYKNKPVPKTYFQYKRGTGFWCTYSFSPGCAYARDILESEELNATLTAWGWEDVDLYEEFVIRNDVEIIRSPDPGLVHIYHAHLACDLDSSESQQKMCRAAQAAQLSSAASSVDYMQANGYLDNITDT